MGCIPLNDGESYSQLSADGRRITRSSFKTGQETGVLFDLDKARGTAKLERIDGYIMSPDEKKIPPPHENHSRLSPHLAGGLLHL